MTKGYKLIKPHPGIDGRPHGERGEELLLSGSYDWKTCDPVLTVELCSKWYELFLIEPVRFRCIVDDAAWRGIADYRIYSIHFGHLQDVAPHGVSPYLDHAPNPLCVRLFARRNNYHLDDLADELITGRWQNEYVDSRVMECDRCNGTGEVVVKSAYDLIPYIKNDSTCRACNGHGVYKGHGIYKPNM